METIMVIGHPKGYYQLLHKILERGFYLINITNQEYNWNLIHNNYKEIYLDILHEYDFSLSEIIKIDKEKHVDAIISVHEFYQVARCKIAHELGLYSFPVNNVLKLTNKMYMKQMFSDHDISTAPYLVFPIDKGETLEDFNLGEKIYYPLIVKMCTGMGSVGVTKVENQKELKKAIRTNKLLASGLHSSSTTEESQRCIIIENYINGNEYTVDGFMINGEWIPMVCCEKYPRMDGPVFQETMYMFSPLDTELFPADLLLETSKAVYAAGIENGPYHIEVRKSDLDNKYYIIEMAPRISGMGSTFYNLLLFASDYDIYDLWIDLMFGRQVEIPELKYKYNTFEYDSYALKSGVIKEFEGLKEVLQDNQLVYYEQFKEIGDYTGGPGMNPETTFVFYFRTNSREESIKKIDWLNENFKILT